MGFHVGQTFGDYTITALLGAGGMGRVYKVEHGLTHRTEAMKVLLAELANETQIRRFEREMQVLARLRHPNIAVLHNAIHSENQLILLMEFLEGRTLESMFAAGRVPFDTGIGYVKQILAALRYAHQLGVVHRDVTPANAMITETGEVKLTDFGVSKSLTDPLLTGCGEILGCLPYLAPEQAKGATRPDPRSDLFSAGAILYEHLTGEKPFGADRRLSSILTDAEQDPRPPSQVDPSIGPQWDEVLGRALARIPANRFQSAEEFLDAIGRAEAPKPSISKRWNWVTAAAMFAGIALLSLVAAPAIRSMPMGPSRIEPPALHIPAPAIKMSAPLAPKTKATIRPVRRTPAQNSQAVVSAPERATAALTENHGTLESTAPVEPAVMAAPPSQSSPASRPPAKRRVWHKLNIFKKRKNSDSSVEQ